MPGPHSNLHGPLLDRELFFARGKGARLWDVDGKEYIDFWNGAGPGILGYGNEEYLEAVKHQLETLQYVHICAQAPHEVELGEKFVRHVPCADMVRFCLSGTESIQLVIRLARAYTGRRYFLRSEGHYHGWLDNVLGGRMHEHWMEHPNPVEYDEDFFGTEGRDPDALAGGFMLPWNDVEALETFLKRRGNEVAIIHMEPFMCNGGC